MIDKFGNPEVDIGDEVVIEGFHQKVPDFIKEKVGTIDKVRAMYPNNCCMKDEILVENCIFYVTMWSKYFDPYFWDVD